MGEFFEENEYYDTGDSLATDTLTDDAPPAQVEVPANTAESTPAPQETAVITEIPPEPVTEPVTVLQTPQKPLSIADVVNTINERNTFNAAEVGIPKQPEQPLGEAPTDKIIPPGADTVQQPIGNAMAAMDPETKEETEFFIQAVNEMLNEGYSHVLHNIADTGKPEDYKANDKDKAEKIAKYGARIASKYGWKLSIELLFGIAVVRNYAPPTMLAINHRRMKKKLDKNVTELDESRRMNAELIKTMTEMVKGNYQQQPMAQATINPPPESTAPTVSPDNIPKELLDSTLMPPAAPQIMSNEWQRPREKHIPAPPAEKKDPSEGGLYYYDTLKRVWRNSITHKAKGGRHTGSRNKPKAPQPAPVNG